MKVRIGRDFYDKKNDIVYSAGEIADVTKETALWMVRNGLGYIIPNVKEGEPVNLDNEIENKALKKSRKNKMVKKANNK